MRAASSLRPEISICVPVETLIKSLPVLACNIRIRRLVITCQGVQRKILMMTLDLYFRPTPFAPPNANKPSSLPKSAVNGALLLV